MNLPFMPTSEDNLADVGQSVADWQYPLDLNRLLLPRPASTFLLRADAKVYDVNIGDILVVDRSIIPARGQLVVAIDEGEMKLGKSPMQEIWGVVTYIVRSKGRGE